MQVTIAGSGGWGTALAILLHENGHDVTLWSHFETESKQLAETHQNPYLPGDSLCSLQSQGSSPTPKGQGLTRNKVNLFFVAENAGERVLLFFPHYR